MGNTRLHCGIVCGQEVEAEAHFSTADFEGQLATWLGEQTLDGIAFCSVVPARSRQLAAAFEPAGLPWFQLTYENTPGLKISYPHPAEVGQDRLANAIAAQLLVAGPAIVLDAGTAVTYDLITPDAGYIGGLIAPGLGMLTDYLHEKTAQLPKVALEDIHGQHPFGHSTAESMAIACAVGFGGMISALTDRALAEMRQRGHPAPALLATGGSIAHLIEASPPWRRMANLTLLGLAEAWRRSRAS